MSSAAICAIPLVLNTLCNYRIFNRSIATRGGMLDVLLAGTDDATAESIESVAKKCFGAWFALSVFVGCKRRAPLKSKCCIVGH